MISRFHGSYIIRIFERNRKKRNQSFAIVAKAFNTSMKKLSGFPHRPFFPQLEFFKVEEYDMDSA